MNIYSGVRLSLREVRVPFREIVSEDFGEKLGDSFQMVRGWDIQGEGNMILSTTPSIDGKKAVKYLGLVSGDAILGANIFRDFFASIRDIVGGRSAAYEAELRKAKDIALGEMREQARHLGANAIVGIDIDYETIGANASMLMVSASGTAVVVE